MIQRLPSRIGQRRYNTLDMTQDERRVFIAWRSIRQRCNCKSCAAYKDYGGRGIKLAPEFEASFEAFFEHIGPPPSRIHSVDRIDNDKGYERGNMRWATKWGQMRNRRCTNLVEWRGKTQCIADWATELGMNRVTIWGRYQKGLRGDELFAPSTNRGRQAVYDDVPGIGFKTLGQISEASGINYSTIVARHAKGWRGAQLIIPVDEAMHVGGLKREEAKREARMEMLPSGKIVEKPLDAPSATP